MGNDLLISCIIFTWCLYLSYWFSYDSKFKNNFKDI